MTVRHKQHNDLPWKLFIPQRKLKTTMYNDYQLQLVNAQYFLLDKGTGYLLELGLSLRKNKLPLRVKKIF